MSDERSASPVDKTIGARVRARRLEIGVSQERLADLIGVTFQQVQKYEKGVNRIAVTRLLEIAHALDCPANMFLENLRGGPSKVRPGKTDGFAEALATPGAHELVRTFAAMTPKVRRRVLDLVRAMDEEG